MIRQGGSPSDHSSRRGQALPSEPMEQRAISAWGRTSSSYFKPRTIEVLKLKRKSAVYRLIGAGDGAPSVIAKRCRAPAASVERVIYEEILPRLPVPALRCHGFAPEPQGEFCWVFLDDAGSTAYSPARPEHRALAGRWLAALHRAPILSEVRSLLPGRAPRHYLELLRFSRTTLRRQISNPALSADDRALVRTLVAGHDCTEAHWGEVERFYRGRPGVVVHGDFVIKNLRVRDHAQGPALLVFDWEMAGWGVPASDLAQDLGGCASPDLEVYGAAIRRAGRHFDRPDLLRIGDYGCLLRLLDMIAWLAISMQVDDYRCLIKPLSSLQRLEVQLATALRAMRWNEHD